jgi:4-amino-4-deoxy-L-arabinose transferase-like glycosyltransferase
MDDSYWRMRRTFSLPRVGEASTSSDFSTEHSLTAPQLASDRELHASVREVDRIRRSSGVPREVMPRSWVIALAVMLFVYLFTCGAPRLFDQIDGQYAGAAREMMIRSDWMTPTQDGVPRLQKPPLVYWCEILSMSVFGTKELGARFPVALATIGWFFATGLLASRVIGTRSAGFAAALILAMFAATFFFAHLVMPEPFLACFMALSFWSLLKAKEAGGERRTGEIDRWLIAAWTFIALGTLAKGIHALATPVVAMSFTAWLRPAMRPVCRRFLLRPHGWILLLTLLLPWYLIVEGRYPGFLKDHFFNEQIGSALSRRWPPDSDRVPLWIFWLEHLILLFPISLLFPAAIRATLRVRKDRRLWISDDGLLLLAWFLVIALGISFSNIQDYYLMIAWAPIAVWMAWTLTKNPVSFKLPAITITLMGAAGLLAAVVFTVSRGGEPGESTSPSLLIGDTILNVFQVLPATVWKEFVPLVYVVSASALVTGLLVFQFNRKGRPDLCLAGCALLMAVIFLTGTRGMQLLEDQFSSAKLVQVIKARARPQSIAIVQGDPNIKTTLFFYFHRPVFWVDGHPDMEFATRSLGIGRDHYLTREQVATLWREANQVFLVIDAGALPEWKAFLALGSDQAVPIGTCGSSVILANR